MGLHIMYGSMVQARAHSELNKGSKRDGSMYRRDIRAALVSMNPVQTHN